MAPSKKIYVKTKTRMFLDFATEITIFWEIANGIHRFVEGGATRGTTALFIDSYIAAYIQVQYRVIGVHPTGLTIARGVGRCPQAPPELWPWPGGEEV